MHRYLLGLVFGSLSAFSHAQTEPDLDEYQIVTDSCTSQKPRFPATYAKHKALKAGGLSDHFVSLQLNTKYEGTGIGVEAALQEIDLTGDGVCDLVVIVTDPISTGGDRDVLATIYVAHKGKWQRIGARSASLSDLPAGLDLAHSPSDGNFEFDGYAALRRPGQAQTSLVAWNYGRVTNGFDGYRVYEIDQAQASLRLIDKWNDEGAKVYAAFKHAKNSDGVMIFETSVEADELRKLCEHITGSSPGLAAECRGRKR